MTEKAIKYLDYGYNISSVMFIIYFINKRLEIISLSSFQWVASLIPTFFCTIILTRYILKMEPETPYKEAKQKISIFAIILILAATFIDVSNAV